MKERPYALGVAYRRRDSELLDDDGSLDDVVADLLDLACSANILDRHVRRGPPGTEAWPRQMDHALCLRRPEVWGSTEVHDALMRLLHWMTEDQWSLVNTPGPVAQPARQMRLPLDHGDRKVVLFSGGLDATAGTAMHLDAGEALLGVAVETNSAMSAYQKGVASALMALGSGDLKVAPVTFHRIGERRWEDASRRTRGLLFLVCGWVAARRTRERTLLVFENGIGALNLPYTAAQSGCMTSRAVHPRTLHLAAELFSLIDESPFAVHNPYLNRTKGWMCSQLPATAALACGLSESCDLAAAGRSPLDRRCGRCSSCLLRRVSLHAAGRSNWDPRPYRADAEGDQGRSAIKYMLWQAAEFARCVTSDRPADDLVVSFPDLGDIPEDIPVLELVPLFSRYVSEWQGYPHPLVDSFLRPLRVAA